MRVVRQGTTCGCPIPEGVQEQTTAFLQPRPAEGELKPGDFSSPFQLKLYSDSIILQVTLLLHYNLSAHVCPVSSHYLLFYRLVSW